MAFSRGVRIHQYLDDWLNRAQSQDEARLNTDCGETNPILGVNYFPKELRTKTHIGIFVCGS